MIQHKKIDVFIIGSLIVSILIVILIQNKTIPIIHSSQNPEYVEKLFNEDRVSTINIIIDDWDDFLSHATDENYVSANLIINNEAFLNVGLRTKGNNSLRLTHKYGHDRYSLKIEMDHFQNNSYYGLDKFSLDASFQDNSYLKTFLTMDMMRMMGVATPLVSYVDVSVNGEPWGLFLAIEEPEEAFLKRNYGNNYGQLYKPDYKKLAHANDDVALKYTDDEFESYDNIFRKAKFNPSKNDKRRLINALKILDSKENLEYAVNIPQVLKYFTVQSFVVNLDSYLGHTGHNYFLYEEAGKLEMLPWDYNLAFATYTLGMPNPINDATRFINHPIDTPASKEVMLNRPLFHHLMGYKDSFEEYHATYDQFITDYIESGYYKQRLTEISTMIDPFVKEDASRYISYEDYHEGVEAITQFIELRGLSVRGQLNKTIPSTIKGQSKDQSNFIDASDLWIPDLGEIKDLKDNSTMP